VANITAAELQARVSGEENFRKLTDDNFDGVEDSIDAFIARLDGEVNGYLRKGGYAVPLADATPIKAAELDIANYRLKTRGTRQASEGDLQLYLDALKFLQAIAAGDILLQDVPTTSLYGEPLLDGRESLLEDLRSVM
jgi:phage gp36-like protein